MRKNIWGKLNDFPPLVCRLLARVTLPSGGVRALTTEEIATKAKLTVAEINSLSWLTSWDDVPLKKVRAFTEACGVDLTNRASLRVHSAYIRRGAPFKYLKKSADWNNVYKPMIAVLLHG